MNAIAERPVVRTSYVRRLKDDRQGPPMIRVYDRQRLLGDARITLSWPHPDCAELRDVDVEVRVSGLGTRVEVYAPGWFWNCTMLHRELYEGDTLRFDLIRLPTDQSKGSR